ncbi:DUF1760-domain-containing protein [Xylona heveae TC161]|uniref:DUF1760-domain-containing protein n=1 Tax=Xylona heveae (strain CBS 132557 / TC161) TaxID=1328760 RepID=A0A165JQ92_XYLHT|nr:DUF1760-domain-containing protein [Xylona heveae TC161]KZF26506.1 DUF1760-domain-containing protein [Xylona heveae TC161]
MTTTAQPPAPHTHENPLLAALPPATDYLTYSTLIEYNLTPDLLPTLHDVLQTPELAANIGWDLIHILVPMLPASAQCLEDIARLGNPREVVLKVAESLRHIDFAQDSADVRSEADHTEDQGRQTLQKEARPSSGGDAAELSLPVLQFNTLVSLLSILHPRIKTKYPSRFLSTTLQALLATYSEAPTAETTNALLLFVKSIAGERRPSLPPRLSSGSIITLSSQSAAPESGAQPEPISREEHALQNRLLQSFVTHIMEEYMMSTASDMDHPGLAWASRFQEKARPEKVVPNRKTFGELFLTAEELRDRETTAGQITALARDLGLHSSDLLAAAQQADTNDHLHFEQEDEPPSAPEEIPLSRAGSLFLLTARKASAYMFGSTPFQAEQFYIFPDHAKLVESFIGTEAFGGMGGAGTEPFPILDALLALGVLAVNGGHIGQAESDDEFNQYLQTMSLISANTPASSLRYHAHTLTALVLHSHPSDIIRLSYIRDTLEHCPLENLKVSAVGWLKTETLSASQHTQPDDASHTSEPSVFSTPVALDTAAPFLFPDLSADYPGASTLQGSHLLEKWTTFRLDLPFYLASLNFYYLLLSATHLHAALDISNLHSNNDIGGSFLGPLREASKVFQASLKDGPLAQEEGKDSAQASILELEILDETLHRVTQAVAKLNVE